jgi:CDP-glucose 4,6-dehydratase
MSTNNPAPESLSRLSGPILVTGHTGFKGTWLTLLLEKLGVTVIGYSLCPTEDSLFKILDREGKITESFSDILDLDSLEKFIQHEKPVSVIHLAAQPLVLESYRFPHQTIKVNALGTSNLFEAISKSREVTSVLIATTDKVYKNLGTGQEFIETDALQGNDPYSSSKVATEAITSAWVSYFRHEKGPAISVARAGNVIGGGDSSKERLLPDIVKAIHNDIQLTIRNPDNTRPWQHVLDPLIGYLKILEKLQNGEEPGNFNFGPSGKSLSVKEVLDIAIKASNKNLNPKYTEESSHLESTTLGLNSKKASDELEWSPIWSQQEAVEATINWWATVKNNPKNPELACNNDIEKAISHLRIKQAEGIFSRSLKVQESRE